MTDDKNPSNNAHVEIDASFFDRLADKFTEKQMAQQQDTKSAVKLLAGVLGSFYKELRQSGIPRSLAFTLVKDLLIVLLKR